MVRSMGGWREKRKRKRVFILYDGAWMLEFL